MARAVDITGQRFGRLVAAMRVGIPATTIKSRLRIGLHPEAALSSRWFKRGTKPRAAA